LAASLEDTLRLVMEEAAHGRHASGGPGHPPAQRIDCLGTKVEELAGTGVPDTQGG
jgi:hypothetical protein